MRIYGLLLSLSLTIISDRRWLAYSQFVALEENDNSRIEKKAEYELNLEDMEDTSLEEICNSRGFELVPAVYDETGSHQHSHEDYVDAARQCLQIEAEMEEILVEKPWLLEDLESESRRLLEVKEGLERDIAESQSQLKATKKEIPPTAFGIKENYITTTIYNETDTFNDSENNPVVDKIEGDVVEKSSGKETKSKRLKENIANNSSIPNCTIQDGQNIASKTNDKKSTSETTLKTVQSVLKDWLDAIQNDLKHIDIARKALLCQLNATRKTTIRIITPTITVLNEVLKPYISVVQKAGSTALEILIGYNGTALVGESEVK